MALTEQSVHKEYREQTEQMVLTEQLDQQVQMALTVQLDHKEYQEQTEQMVLTEQSDRKDP